MNAYFRLAGFSGIVALILGIFLMVLEVLKASKFNTELPLLHVGALLASLIFYCLFMYGFTLIARRYKNELLKISSYMLIALAVVEHIYSIWVIFAPQVDNIIVTIFGLVILGGANIPFGIALLQLKRHFGSLATAAGVVEITIGASVMSVVLAFLALLLLLPSYILSSMILFQAAEKK